MLRSRGNLFLHDQSADHVEAEIQNHEIGRLLVDDSESGEAVCGFLCLISSDLQSATIKMT